MTNREWSGKVILVTYSDKMKGGNIVEGFGKILVQLRGEKTQEEVAKSIGIATSTLAMYETEKRTPRDTIKVKISEYYNRPVQEIFFNRNVTNEDKT